ncbi:PAT family beta-lactamase induction signal transducer AmpG [Advenella incenata]|jgi:PAT family beta-lactamase induction signal transducer AmpG|uniref:PAT family beta-lactamase induction signal transducer AmpG n=1 Tax=Advenella incenata TaxID=267800 RepID=A0A4Q7VS89_9BURK|nr:MFS transporter [Advenella incenata]RZT99332.1 PAT family beta-lactamase induction signal transducer AmpG [Advenella incenata]
MINLIRPYLSPRVYPLLLLGLASGLPLALTGGTLQAWATVEDVPLTEIGFLTLVGAAYTFKFLWAPFIDRYVPPFMGRRRGWMALSQILLGLTICGMGLLDPSRSLFWLAALATLVAFLSATQDIAFDAYSADVLRHEERAAGAAIRTLGYRIGMVVSGGLAIWLAAVWMGWSGMYVFMGLLMFGAAVLTWLAPEPEVAGANVAPRTLYDAFTVPFQEFFSRKGAISILALIVLYKLGDAFAGALSTTFLIRGAGFSPEVVGSVNKILAVVATIVGALIGGGIMGKLGLYRSLMLFGLLQALSNLMYMLIALHPQNLPLMALGVGFENLCGGLGTAAFVALLMALCHVQFTASQFALLSALSAVGRVFVAGPLTPPIVEAYGWPAFFVFTFFIALPGLLVLWFMRAEIKALEKDPSPEPETGI